MTKPQFQKIKDISPQDQAMVDRLIADPRKGRAGKELSLNPSAIAGVFRRNVREISDIQNIFKAMPWLHLSREILVSSITSPGDLIQTTLSIYNKVKGLPPSLSSQLDKVLKDFHIDEMGMENKVYEWVDEAMIMKGSHPILIIPEASLDKMLGVTSDTNVSMESVSSFDSEYVDGWYKPKGLFGIHVNTDKKETYVSMENAKSQLGSGALKHLHTIRTTRKVGTEQKVIRLPVTVTDNLAILRKPQVDAYVRSRHLHEIYGDTAFEAAQKKTLTAGEIHKQFFKRPKPLNNGRLQIVPVTKPDQNKNLGHPLTFHLPAESVFPVYVPGDVTNHPWYILILDPNNGYPVSWQRQMYFYDDVRNYTANNGSEGQSAGDILQLARETTSGSVPEYNAMEIDRATEINAEIIEHDLINRLGAGLAGGSFEISMPDVVKRMLFARNALGQQTALLLVPADYMIYMAYEYNEFGVGKSILEDGKSLAAQAAAVHVANILGVIQNAIPGKDINIELDPDDGNPMETAMYMANEALGIAYRQFPGTIGSVTGLTEQLQLSAFNINVSGNPRYPEVKTSISPRESQQVVIDTELQQQLKDGMNNLFGLTPELVDNMNQPDFATTAVNNSIQLLKRVMVGQAKTNPFLTDYIRTFTYNSGVLISRLLEVLETNKKDIPKDYENTMDLLEDYLNNVYCELPKPQTENLIKQAELLEKMESAVDTVLDANFKMEYLGGFNDEVMEEAYPVLREGFKGLMLRHWMRKHGIFRDLDVFTSNEDGSPLADLNAEMMNHTEVLRSSIGEYYKDIAEFVIRRKNKTQKAIDAGQRAKSDEPGQDDLELSDTELNADATGAADTSTDNLDDGLDSGVDDAPVEPVESPEEEEEEANPPETPPEVTDDTEDDTKKK